MRCRQWLRVNRERFTGGLFTTEQALQQTRAWACGFAFRLQIIQRLPLQAAQLTEQQRYLPRLRHATIELLGEGFQRTSHLAGQRQLLQLGDQGGERGADLVDAGFATLLRIQHGLFQAWQ